MNTIKLHYIYLFATLTVGIFLPIAAQNPQLDADIKLYNTRCSQCHDLEMASNEETILPSEVMPLIDRMMDIPGSLIQNNEKIRLYQIALYKVYTNQRNTLNKRLEKLSPEQKKKEIEALKIALQPYKK